MDFVGSEKDVSLKCVASMRQRLTDLHHAGLSTIQNPSALFFCAKAKHQQQLRRGVIDNKKALPSLKLRTKTLLHSAVPPLFAIGHNL